MSVIKRFDTVDLAKRFDVSELQAFVEANFDARLRSAGDEMVLERLPDDSSAFDEGFTELNDERRQALGDHRRAAGMDSTLGERR